MVKTPSKAEEKKKFNYTKWGFVVGMPVALLAAGAALVVVPEIRCGLGWKSETCPVHDKDVSFVVQSEDGRSLDGVKVQVFAQGAPEVHYTDSNGYAIVKITNKGTVRVALEKQQYPVQNLTINLENDQNTVRIIRLNKGTDAPNVQSVAKISDIIALSPSPSPSASPSPTPSVLTFTGDKGTLFKNQQGDLTAQAGKQKYSFTLGNPGIVDLYLKDVSNEVVLGLYADSGNGTPKNYSEAEVSATRSKPAWIRKRLETGKYYVIAFRKEGDTKFTLSGVNYTDRTKDLGAIGFNVPTGEKASLNADNRQQFYRFSLGSPSVLGLSLTDVQNETSIKLYADDGTGLPKNYPEAEETATSSKPGKIERKLETGSYIVVVGIQGGDTNYSLSVNAASP
jgi:hypothetical protein